MEFIFEDIIYKYENGWIYGKHEYGYFYKVCPVLNELEEILELFTEEGRRTILEAIVHGSCYSFNNGKEAKVAEIKRALDIADIA
jgi:hypothetical protein